MRILLLQTSFLGDVILSTPVIAGINAKYPGSKIWMMTTPQAVELVKRDPLLAGVITFDKRGSEKGVRGFFRKVQEIKSLKLDIAIALQRSARTALLLGLAEVPKRIGFRESSLSFMYTEKHNRDKTKHDVERNFSILGDFSNSNAKLKELRLFAPSRPDFTPEFSEKLNNINKPIIFVPGSAWATKRWHWEHYREVVNALISNGHTILLLGSKAEQSLCDSIAKDTQAINLAGEITISQMMWLFSRSKLVICNDSMALHMASAFKVPNIAIFCATSPSFGFGPWRNKAVILEREGLSCKPCARHGSMKCPVGTNECMTGLRPEQVLTVANELLR